MMTEIEFNDHLKQWNIDTRLQSNYHFHITNEHFKAIVEEGESVAEYLYKAMLSDEIGHLHLFMGAIYGPEITKEVQQQHTSSVAPGWVGLKISEIRQAWINWYETNKIAK